ncbi:MAG: N-acetylmuramoyl-L-alanine amidase [Desulfofustis sp.]
MNSRSRSVKSEPPPLSTFGTLLINPVKKFSVFAAAACFLLCLTAAAPNASATSSADIYEQKLDLDAHYQKAKFYYNQLLNPSSTLSDKRENWLKGTRNFRRIYLAEPKSELAPACLFMLGRLYYDIFKKFGKGIDLGEALSYYRDVNTLFPDNRLADDALFAVGRMLYEDVNDPGRAADTFSKIITEHPDGDMRSAAETELKRLSKYHDIPLPEEMLDDAPLAKLTNIMPPKYWSSKDYTRIVVQTSGPTTYQEELLEKVGNRPRRLYIDFQNSYIEPRYRSPIPIQDGLLKQVRTGQFSPDTVRVVLDIESISDYKIFSLPDPFRVVIDVKGQSKQPEITSVAPLAPPPAPPKLSTQPRPSTPPQLASPEDSDDTESGSTARITAPVQTTKRTPSSQEPVAELPLPESTPIVVLRDSRKLAALSERQRQPPEPVQGPVVKAPELSLAQQLGLGIGTIVIDPGHGGKDPGAIAFGMKEKDIVLKTGQRLAAHLRKKLGATVILTRDDDTFLPLEERTAIANTSSADLFISLHINAHPSPDIRGFETYFLNLTTNAEAMRVAARENATSSHQLSELQDILADIMRNSKINESSRLADRVHESIDSGLVQSGFGVKDMGVKQAPFYVLIGAEMPAILIEIAFISNPDDASLLGDDGFLDKLAERISDGISHYARTNIAAADAP